MSHIIHVIHLYGFGQLAVCLCQLNAWLCNSTVKMEAIGYPTTSGSLKYMELQLRSPHSSSFMDITCTEFCCISLFCGLAPEVNFEKLQTLIE